MEMELLGEVVQRKRIDLGLSQDELCEGICEPITLSRLENGKNVPSHNRVKALLQRLNIPDDRYYALSSQNELELANARKEVSACYSRFERAGADQKRQAWELAMEQIHRLEELAEQGDTITRQFILSNRVALGKPDGPYSFEERMSILLEALRLTVPKFNLEKIGGRRYSIDEAQVISQIAKTYSSVGEYAKAIELYRQLFEYVHKHADHLSNFAAFFTLIAHNYALELGSAKYYHESIKIAKAGKQTCIDYSHYRFLPGFLAILGESYFLVGEKEKSKKMSVQAHYLYEVLNDEHNLRIIDSDIKERFQLEFLI